MEVRYDLAIVGGGPAGCAAAITAARAGKRVALFERLPYPRQRVCGEFISAESHDVLALLLEPHHPLLANPPRIVRARMFSDGNCVEFPLPHPAWSIPRFDLDLALWSAAKASGVECIQASVERIDRTSEAFDVQVAGQSASALRAINASGRWSNLRRPIVENGPRWIGIKAHFAGEAAPPSADLYFFAGGYCGVQPISSTHLNASAMVRADVATTLEQVFALHPDLWTRSRAWERTTDLMTTSPLVHATPEPVTDGVLNAGDAAAFIDPFVGDGISMALRSGVLAANCKTAEEYAAEYRRRFLRAFHTASLARKIIQGPAIVRKAAAVAFRSKSLGTWALKRTRGI